MDLPKTNEPSENKDIKIHSRNITDLASLQPGSKTISGTGNVKKPAFRIKKRVSGDISDIVLQKFQN